MTKQAGKMTREYLSMTFTSRTRIVGIAFRARLPMLWIEALTLAVLRITPVVVKRRLALNSSSVTVREGQTCSQHWAGVDRLETELCSEGILESRVSATIQKTGMFS